MRRSSTNELFTLYKEPEREFRSSRRHFKTLSLGKLRSIDFNLLFDQEYSEEEVAETMAETMEQYIKVREYVLCALLGLENGWNPIGFGYIYWGSLKEICQQMEGVREKAYVISGRILHAVFDKLVDKQSGRPFGSLPSNTQPNLKGHNSKAYQPPQFRNEHVNDVFTRSAKSYNPPVNPNDQQNHSETPINFNINDEDEESTPQLKTQNPKPVKETPIPKPYKPKIPLADRSFQYPIGIAENMLVEVGKFTFLADFVILKMEEDSKVSLILGRPFLHSIDAVIRVKQKQLNLGVGTERMVFNIDSAMKHSYSNDDTCFSIDVIDE
ncbi:reverse transcriptase domain-containing protein, partial [Tanacetum coccineum]